MTAAASASSSAPPSPDPARCPLCGATNSCAMEIARDPGAPQPPCWCMSATFTDDLRARVPLDAQGLACICASCVAAAAALTESPAP